MPTSHARYAPSKLSRIMACPGSLSLSEVLPEPPESSYAAEGTLLHEYMKDAVDIEILGVRETAGSLDAYFSNRTVSLEHQILVRQTLDAIHENILHAAVGDYVIHQDMRVRMRGFEDDVNGTLDLGIQIGTQAIHIIDFKFVAGVEVDAEDNPQLLAYLDGFLNHIGIGVNDDHPKEMWVWIFQPRLDKFEGVRVFKEDLEYYRARIEKTIILAEGKFPPFRPGKSQCRFCNAGAVCKYRMRHVHDAAISALSAQADMSAVNHVYTMGELAEILGMESQVTAAFDAIKQHLYNTAMSGNDVPGYKLVPGRASRKWINEDSIVDDLAFAFELDTEDLIEIKTKSPAAVEKLIPAKRKKELENFYVKTEGAYNLVPETSKKAAVTPGTAEEKAQKAFASLADTADLE